VSQHQSYRKPYSPQNIFKKEKKITQNSLTCKTVPELHLFNGRDIAFGSTRLRKLDRFRKISPRIPVFIDPCSIQISMVQCSSRNCINKFTRLKASLENEKVKYTEHISMLAVSIPQKQRSCIGTHRTPWTLHLEKTISVPKWSQATDKFHCGQLLYWIWRLSFQYPQRLSKGRACPILQGPVECK
jgi:hypothetical protein